MDVALSLGLLLFRRLRRLGLLLRLRGRFVSFHLVPEKLQSGIKTESAMVAQRSNT